MAGGKEPWTVEKRYAKDSVGGAYDSVAAASVTSVNYTQPVSMSRRPHLATQNEIKSIRSSRASSNPAVQPGASCPFLLSLALSLFKLSSRSVRLKAL